METFVFVIITKSAPRIIIRGQCCTHGHRFALNATHFGFSIIIPEYDESGRILREHSHRSDTVEGLLLC